MFRVPRFSLFFLSLILASWAFPHGGRLGQNGGHVDSKTGYFHCHTSVCYERYGDDVGPVKPRESAAFVTLYDRDEWPHWSDLDGDCQNTRSEVLQSASLERIGFAEDRQCDVKSGFWLDPYSGKQYREASELSIDHLVPLRWAHGHGGDRWTRRQKEAFANDEANLLVVESRLNSEKGAKGPDEWLPPEIAYRCEYLQRFVAVMAAYGLRFVEAEREALAGELQRCEAAN